MGFFLFGLGLFICGQSIGEAGFNISQSTSHKLEIPLRPLRFVIAMIVFSAISNAVLLFPALLEALFGLDASIAIKIHKIGIVVLAGCVLALVAIGSISALRFCGCKSISFNAFQHFRPALFVSRNDIQASEIIFIALAILIYYFNTLTSGYVADTGLYHFPFVRHLVDFGAEIGLANFHSRFGFYNIQLFGQVPIQAFAFGKTLVAPSFNIYFFAAFLMFAYESILSSVALRHIELSALSDSHVSPWLQARPVSIIAYWISMFAFGLTSRSSFISYDADFSAAIIATLVCYSFIVGAFLGPEVLILAASMPLLKLSGVVAILYVFLFIITLGLCRNIFLRHSICLPNILGRLKALGSSWGFPASIILSLYIVYFSTNLTLTGYLVFPQYKTGPIGDHAVPYQDVAVLKDRWITGWARFKFDGAPREVKANASLGAWLPQFIRSGRGRKMLFWIVSSFFVAACSIVGITFKRNKSEFIMLFASAMSAGVVSTLVLLSLPPDPRFYPWIDGLITFNSIQLIVLAPASGLIAFSMFVVASSMVLPNRLAKMEVPELQASKFAKNEVNSAWKTRANPDQLNVIIRQPAKQACWSADPPCSPYPPSHQ